MSSLQQLVQKIWNYCNILRDDGLSYVIALARMRGGIVVTQETPAAEKRNPKRTHFIPDVCRELVFLVLAYLASCDAKVGVSNAQINLMPTSPETLRNDI